MNLIIFIFFVKQVDFNLMMRIKSLIKNSTDFKPWTDKILKGEAFTDSSCERCFLFR